MNIRSCSWLTIGFIRGGFINGWFVRLYPYKRSSSLTCNSTGSSLTCTLVFIIETVWFLFLVVVYLSSSSNRNETREKEKRDWDWEKEREREIRMELDFSSVGVDIWFLPHVRSVVLSNYSLYSSIRWSPVVVVIGHRIILRLECCWWLLLFFLLLLYMLSIELYSDYLWFFTLYQRNHRSISYVCVYIYIRKRTRRDRWTFPLSILFLNRKRKGSIFINFG